MNTALYLLLGVFLMGGLFLALNQISVRQRRLNQDLVRLERLAAEVAMSAEAVLERVDERVEHLNRLLAVAESASLPAGESAKFASPPAFEEAVAPLSEPPAVQLPAKPDAAARRRAAQAYRSAAEVAEEQAAGAEPEAAESPEPAPKKRTSRKREKEAPEAPQAVPPEEAPGPGTSRYQQVRAAVWSLADQGKDAGQIAAQLGVPRGEVMLMLNLRGKKVTA